ncbi:MAG: hypothetical protein ACM31C_27815 [Acidobacteriota bacterium]
MRRLAVVALLAACRKEPDCKERLAAVAKLFTDVAVEQQASPVHLGADHAEWRAGFDEAGLVTVQGAPADISKADYLAVGRERAALATADGEIRDVLLDDDAPLSADPSRSLVIAFGADAPWASVDRIRHRLSIGDREDHYGAVALAYQTAGALAGRTPPPLPGATADHVDVPTAGAAIAKEAADHCPAIAVDFGKLRGSGTLEGMLVALARDVPTCTCATDLGRIEAIAWLVKRRIVTTVAVLPAGSTAPPLPAVAGDATFADAIRANGGKPIVLVLESPPPPPPRPPLPHRR